MAELVVSAATGALKPLMEKLAAALGEEYKRFKGVPGEINSLTQELEAMDAYLLKMSEVENPDPQDKVCMKEVRELSYDMEDCIDEFLLHIGDKAKTPDGLIAKLKNIIITKPKVRRQIAKVIKKLKFQVKEMGERSARYKTHETISKASNTHVDKRALVIFEDASKLVGLEGPKRKLVELLTKKDGIVPLQPPMVLSIVGPGGLGKTTLANQVYLELKGEFESHAFVSVSRNPDLLNVLRNILCHVSNEPHPNMQAWDTQLLISKINDSLRDKRYLIVIDDIWTKDAWETINYALCKNNKDSKIITTTRVHDVAKACCRSDGDFVYKMEALGSSDSETLFFQRLFGSKDKCPTHLRGISKNILGKCDGLPLAIISISGLLANKPQTDDEWERVQNSIGRGLGKDQDVDRMTQILSLSYFDLPHYLKTCLLYLSVFPEDFVIDKKHLLRRWSAEGFIHKEQEQTLYELGERCFNELINRSLIQGREINMYGEVTACQVHDIILDFIVSKSEEENFITVSGDGYQMNGQHSKVRRLSIHASSREKASTLTQLDLSHVRSVSVFHYSVELPLWSNFSFLRVLDFHGCKQVKDDHLTDIGNLFQLKYLSLRRTGVCELPEQIRKLTCLETLDLKMSKVRKLPASIVQLQGLVYLAVDRGVKLPDGTGRMTALEDLDCVDVFKQSVHFPQEFGQLKNLRNVQLFLNSGNCSVPAEGSYYKENMSDVVSSICKHSLLHSLSIGVDPDSIQDFSLDSGGGDAPSGLQKFEITSHFISKVPNWVRSLMNLRFLTLYVKEFEGDDLMTLGRLPVLVFLRFVAPACFHGRTITISGADGFQSLGHFDYGCAIPVTFEAGAMPNIKQLTLLFNIFKTATSLPLRNEGLLYPFGVQHLTSLGRVYCLVYFPKKDTDAWFDGKKIQMAYMSCEELNAIIYEIETIELFSVPAELWEKTAHLKAAPTLKIRETMQWSLAPTSGPPLFLTGKIYKSRILSMTSRMCQIRRQVEEWIRNCPHKGEGNCQCRALRQAKAQLTTSSVTDSQSLPSSGVACAGMQRAAADEKKLPGDLNNQATEEREE